MNYFQTTFSVNAIRTLYRELAMQFHPDRGGDVRKMQEINAQYHEALKRADGKTSKTSEGKEYTYRYDRDSEDSVIQKLNEIVSRCLPAVEIHLMGKWIWITGETKPVKDVLKAMGCRFSGDKQCWYWRDESQKKFYKKNSKPVNLRTIAYRYGCSTFRAQRRDQIDG